MAAIAVAVAAEAVVRSSTAVLPRCVVPLLLARTSHAERRLQLRLRWPRASASTRRHRRRWSRVMRCGDSLSLDRSLCDSLCAGLCLCAGRYRDRRLPRLLRARDAAWLLRSTSPFRTTRATT